MTIEQFPDRLVAVTATIDQSGNTTPGTLTLQGKTHSIISVGRQWETEEGRHILIETAGGERYELQLSRISLVWRIKRAWLAEMAA